MVVWVGVSRFDHGAGGEGAENRDYRFYFLGGLLGGERCGRGGEGRCVWAAKVNTGLFIRQRKSV